MLPSELIERGWCQLMYAQTKSGRRVMWSDTQACRWCIKGAINRSQSAGSIGPLDALNIQRAARELCGESIQEFNDYQTTTKEEVLFLICAAEVECGIGVPR